jgi:membrane-associated phospholipid phosphatase
MPVFPLLPYCVSGLELHLISLLFKITFRLHPEYVTTISYHRYHDNVACLLSISQRKGRGVLTKFLQLAASSVPLTYLLKDLMQFIFGLTNIRLWLRTRGEIEFNWFRTIESGGFPSGHSIVITAFFTAV